MKILKNKLISLHHSNLFKGIEMIKASGNKNPKEWGILILVVLITNIIFCYLWDIKINFFGIVFRVYLALLAMALYFKKINFETFTKSKILNKL